MTPPWSVGYIGVRRDQTAVYRPPTHLWTGLTRAWRPRVAGRGSVNDYPSEFPERLTLVGDPDTMLWDQSDATYAQTDERIVDNTPGYQPDTFGIDSGIESEQAFFVCDFDYNELPAIFNKPVVEIRFLLRAQKTIVESRLSDVLQMNFVTSARVTPDPGYYVGGAGTSGPVGISQFIHTPVGAGADAGAQDIEVVFRPGDYYDQQQVDAGVPVPQPGDSGYLEYLSFKHVYMRSFAWSWGPDFVAEYVSPPEAPDAGEIRSDTFTRNPFVNFTWQDSVVEDGYGGPYPKRTVTRWYEATAVWTWLDYMPQGLP